MLGSIDHLGAKLRGRVVEAQCALSMPPELGHVPGSLQRENSGPRETAGSIPTKPFAGALEAILTHSLVNATAIPRVIK
jgi:hypothetical protein